MVSEAWYQRRGVRDMMSEAWCRRRSVSGLVSDVWCETRCETRCQTCGVSGVVSEAGGKSVRSLTLVFLCSFLFAICSLFLFPIFGKYIIISMCHSSHKTAYKKL
ncbi:MAG: hypothetical protein LBK25_02970 [Treponema sp.]|nr:hypothetical protein [Treponema sp.]